MSSSDGIPRIGRFLQVEYLMLMSKVISELGIDRRPREAGRVDIYIPTTLTRVWLFPAQNIQLLSRAPVH
jgi:hypothetical protein